MQWKISLDSMQLNNIHDLVLIRFADVLLMQSELKKDVAGINEVRLLRLIVFYQQIFTLSM